MALGDRKGPVTRQGQRSSENHLEAMEDLMDKGLRDTIREEVSVTYSCLVGTDSTRDTPWSPNPFWVLFSGGKTVDLPPVPIYIWSKRGTYTMLAIIYPHRKSIPLWGHTWRKVAGRVVISFLFHLHTQKYSPQPFHLVDPPGWAKDNQNQLFINYQCQLTCQSSFTLELHHGHPHEKLFLERLISRKGYQFFVCFIEQKMQ